MVDLINIETLDRISKFINLKQVCDLSNVSYNNIIHKVNRFREGKKSKLNFNESVNLCKGIKSLGDKLSNLN